VALPARFISDDRDAMNTPKQYRQQAADCLKLAGEAHEAYARAALADLADELRETADEVERRAKREQAGRCR
jgi:hypothetical protein